MRLQVEHTDEAMRLSVDMPPDDVAAAGPPAPEPEPARRDGQLSDVDKAALNAILAEFTALRDDTMKRLEDETSRRTATLAAIVATLTATQFWGATHHVRGPLLLLGAALLLWLGILKWRNVKYRRFLSTYISEHLQMHYETIVGRVAGYPRFRLLGWESHLHGPVLRPGGGGRWVRATALLCDSAEWYVEVLGPLGIFVALLSNQYYGLWDSTHETDWWVPVVWPIAGLAVWLVIYGAVLYERLYYNVNVGDPPR